MNRTTNYLRRGWQALQNDTHWIRTIVLMALASLVPIVGPIFVVGYCYMWAKEAAWGMDKPLPSNLDGMGERGKYGLYAAVIEIVWLVIFWVIRAFCENITWLWVILTVIMVIVSVLASVAIMRALIYDRFRPGFQVIRVFRMAAQDIGGLARCFGIGLIGACAVVVGMLLVYLVADFGIAGLLVEDASLIDSAFSSVSSMGTFTITLFFSSILIVALFLAMAFASTLFSALSIRAYGYWIGQFEPQNWGGPDAPMPFEQDDEQFRQIVVVADAEPADEPKEQPADDTPQDDAAAVQAEEAVEPKSASAADDKPEETGKPTGSKATRPAAKGGPASTEPDESDEAASDTSESDGKAKRASTRKKSTAKKESAAPQSKTTRGGKAADTKDDADDKPAESDAAEGESGSEDTK